MSFILRFCRRLIHLFRRRRLVHIEARDVTSEFYLKIHSGCDLACPHCYMFEDLKPLWPRPLMMSRKIVVKVARGLRRYVREHRLGLIRVILHGGEPLLVNVAMLRFIIVTLRKYAPKGVVIEVSIQTNATRLTAEHLEMALELGNVSFSVSLDGDAKGNTSRPYRNGRGSYERVRESLLLFDNDRYRHLLSGLLCVMRPTDPNGDPNAGNDPEETTAELMRYGVPFDFIFPIASWEPGTEPTERPVPTDAPFAIWLMRAFRYWATCGDPKARPPRIRIIDQLLQLIWHEMNGTEPHWTEYTEVLGGWTSPAIGVETDGSMRVLDGLDKAVGVGESDTGLNVFDNTFTEALIRSIEMAEERGIIECSPICQGCEFFKICGGAHYLERHGPINGYRNPSKYCTDWQVLITEFTLFFKQCIEAQAAESASK